MSSPPSQKKAKLLQEKEDKVRVTSKKTQEELLMADYDSIDSSSSVSSGLNVSTSLTKLTSLTNSPTTKSNNDGVMPSIEDSSANFLSDDIEELSQAEVSDLISFISYRDYSPVNKKEESKEEVKTKKLSYTAADKKSKQTNRPDDGSKQSKKM